MKQALEEDIRDGDHTSHSCIRPDAKGKAQLLIKDSGILAGVELAQKIFYQLDPAIRFHLMIADGAQVKPGEIAFELSGNAHAILTAERLALNCMQRMSGIATLNNEYVKKIEGYPARILDTRKTTPLFSAAEKLAVRIGGGHNHRFGLFDMILIKDNHIDYAGGIVAAISATRKYLVKNKLELRVEIEARNLEEAGAVLADALVQGFGLGWILVMMEPAAWGARLVLGMPLTRVPLRLLGVFVAVLLGIAGFAGLKLGSTWPYGIMPGGSVRTLALHGVTNLLPGAWGSFGPFWAPLLCAGLGALLFFPALGFSAGQWGRGSHRALVLTLGTLALVWMMAR